MSRCVLVALAEGKKEKNPLTVRLRMEKRKTREKGGTPVSVVAVAVELTW